MSKIFEWPCQRAKRASDRIVTKAEVGVAVIQRHAPRFKRHQQRSHRCVDSKHDRTASRPLWRIRATKVKATHTRRRLAHERRSQIARINTALSNYFSVLRAIHLHSTQKLSFQSWLNASERMQSPMRNFVVEFNFKCLTPATTIRQCTVMVGCKLQIFHL
jgi:hypothetical protein